MDIQTEKKAAKFSDCGKYRYWLSRIWDNELPLVMFIGLNPSKANGVDDDNTIKRVRLIAKNHGYGGFYMLNCFPYISTKPALLQEFGNTALNDHYLYDISKKCLHIVFAWGNFTIVKKSGRDEELKGMFPGALALFINKNGSPKHPLFCRGDIKLIKFRR
jgi:hypothetical protein